MLTQKQLAAVYLVVASFLEHFDKQTAIINLQGMLMAARADHDMIRVQIYKDAITHLETIENKQ